MISKRPARERGQTRLNWLDSQHTFSFGNYYDPAHHHFRALRVLNEDVVAAGGGFDLHPHRDMEILTYVLQGELEHRDSLGNGSIIRPGDVQRMSAGTGIVHGEFNPSSKDSVHLLQIWLQPSQRGLPPSYEERHFDPQELAGQLRLVASPDGRAGSVRIHQDANLLVARLAAGQVVEQELSSERHAWLQVAKGAVEANHVTFQAGDGAAVSAENQLRITARSAAEVLLFDLA